MYSSLIAFAIVFALVPILERISFFSPIKKELDEHACKAGTPMIGSVAMIIAFLASVIYFRGARGYEFIFLLGVFLFFLIGFADDVVKVIRKSSDGLSSILKLVLQLAVSIIISCLIRRTGLYTVHGLIYYPLSVLYLTAFVNAANITDGLDGLLVKSSLPSLILLGVILGSGGNSAFIMAAILTAFLFYNSNPASVFMGDAGSHMVGAVIGIGGLVSGHPVLIVISALMLFAGLVSSFIQIVSIRCFNRRVFMIAPCHHALQKKGFKEGKITDIYLVYSALFSLIAYLLLFGGKVWL